MKRSLFITLLLAPLAALCATTPAHAATIEARSSPKGTYSPYLTKTLKEFDGFKPQTVRLSQYGGRTDQKEKATGFFYAKELAGRWWLVDPEGCRFLSVGINSVADGVAGTSATSTAANSNWVERTAAMLHEAGINTLGCWSDGAAFRRAGHPMPYCLRWNFMSSYRNQRKHRYPGTGTAEAIYPFDPEFETFCDQHAKALEATKDDPWLFGHFSDNELPFHESGIVARYLSFPDHDPCHLAAAQFMANRKGGKPKKQDDRAFLELVVSEYYRKVQAAIKKYDPNHLFIGSRFHGLALASPALFQGAGKYADVISVNYYHRWTPENDRINGWSKLAGKPILISEWYAMAGDAGVPNNTGAGWIVRAQADRAQFYQHFTLSLLGNPGCVGWHWFKYCDSDKNNPGVVNRSGEPYRPLLQAMQEVNRQVYALADFLRKQD
jgi:hypothetical protein